MRFRNILKTTFIFALVAGSMSAQTFMQGWDIATKFTTGNTSGGLGNSVALNNPNSLNTFAFGLEFTKGNFVVGLDYQYMPGNFRLDSYIPHLTFSSSGAPTSVGAAGTYQTIIRKPEANLYNFNFLYRYPMPEQDLYLQGGLRASMARVTETDTGSREVWSSTTVLASSSAIAERREAKTTSFNPTIGVGREFTERFRGELNLTQSKMTFPSRTGNVSKTGFITELSFGIKF